MKRNRRICLALLCLMILLTLASLCLGASGISPAAMLDSLLYGEAESAAGRILRYVRLPRCLAAILAGAALALSGYLLQGVLRNPLAAPGVIGVNSGAGFFALICMAVLPTMGRLVPLAAFAGACFAVFAVYLLARLTGASKTTIILSGVAVNSLFGAAMDGIVTFFPEAVTSRSMFSIGGFSTATLQQIGLAALLSLPAFLAALLCRRELQILSLGDDIARSLGLKLERFRAVFLISAAMLAGAAVSFAGLLGFVGLLAPHMSRILCRNESHLQLPITSLFGACLCLACDLIARLAFAPYELPVGVVLSLLGASFFIWLLFQRKKRSRHAGE